MLLLQVFGFGLIYFPTYLIMSWLLSGVGATFMPILGKYMYIHVKVYTYTYIFRSIMLIVLSLCKGYDGAMNITGNITPTSQSDQNGWGTKVPLNILCTNHCYRHCHPYF